MNTKELDNLYVCNTYKRANVEFVSGKGSFLYDNEGKEYIDFGSGIAVNGLGVGNDKWLSAVIKQATNLSHASNLYYTYPQAKLAQMLCERTGFKKVFFGNSGAEANEGAIKVARKYFTDKTGLKDSEIITLVNSFHGRTIATLKATGQDVFHQYFYPFPEGFKYAKANDLSDLEEKISPLTCAIMLEMVQGEGGVVALDKEYVKNVRKLCDEKDILLIVDEVQTGNGRCGSLYAYMEYGIMPDVITTAKGLGNGLPIGAVMMGEKVKDTFTLGSHGSTFGGNLVSCAGAIEVLNQIDDSLLKGVKERSKIIKERLSKCAKVKSVSGMGLMLGLEVDDAANLKDLCLEKGLVVLTAKNKLRLLPALNIDLDVLDKGLSILEEVLN